MTAHGDTTTLGGLDSAFPSTSISLLRKARDLAAPGAREAYDQLCRRYWKPVYSYIRSFRACTREEAKDLTQDFFLEILDGKLIDRYMPQYGSFRNFLRGTLKIFVLHHRRKASALKRGGDRNIVSINDDEAKRLEDLVAGANATPEELFDRQWANTVTEQAVEALRRELLATGKDMYLQVFDRYELVGTVQTPPTYGDLAKELGIKGTDVSNYLTWCRRRLRELMVGQIREYVTDEKDAAAELLQLFSK